MPRTTLPLFAAWRTPGTLRFFIRAAATIACVSIVAVGSARAASPTFSDEVFNNADWTQTFQCASPYSQCASNCNAFSFCGSVGGQQQIANGNPNQFRNGTTVTVAHIGNSQSFGMNMRSGVLYTPSSQGPITSLKFDIDVKHLENAVTALGPALQQSGKFYYYAPLNDAGASGWSHRQLTGLTSADFRTVADANDHPNFTASGTTIQFGYVQTLAWGCCSATHGIAGYDNWAVTVNPVTCPSISIDATALEDPTFLLDGVSYSTSTVHTLSLLSGLHKIEANAPCGIPPTPVFFVVDGSDCIVTFGSSSVPALSGHGTNTLVVNSLPFPPRGDDTEPSLGLFKVLIAPKFKAMMAGYPGYSENAWVHRLVSPVMYDPTTRIGRSSLHYQNDILDTGGTPVGTAGTMISDGNMTIVPGTFNSPAGWPELHTEVYKLSMVARDGSGFAVRAGTQAPTRPVSAGEIQPREDATGFYPARSFFNVWPEVDLPLLGGNPGSTVMYTQTPLVVRNEDLNCFPPTVVYLHKETGPVSLRFKTADTQATPRWAAGDHFGWLVLAGHGINYEPLAPGRAKDGTRGVTTAGDLDEFLDIMEAETEMADTATTNADMLDMLTTIPVSYFQTAAQRDDMIATLQAAADAMNQQDPCTAVELLQTKRQRVDGHPTPLADWVSDPTARKALYDRLTALIVEDTEEALLFGGCFVGVEDQAKSRLAAIQYIRPNPTSGDATVGFTLPQATHVSLAVYDLNGRRLRTLFDGEQVAGPHRVAWDAKDAEGGLVANGVYFVRLTTREFTDVRKVTIAK